MTDNEIIKTLERCETSNGYCYDCPLEDIAAIQNIQVCQDKLITEAYKLIDRQNTEIEQLQTEKDFLIRTYADCQKELLKEFSERVKTAFYIEFDEIIPSIMADKIDEIYKEMVGEI